LKDQDKMSQSDIAVAVRGLSKSYTIAHNQEKHSTLAETVLQRLKNPLKREQTETFWALKEVSFDIKKGDVVGIIGRNGAGKSTLLKVLSRITEPTKGEVQLYGRVGSLLEVGTGFHPELTGRENVYLNGAILGMSKGEIRKQFDAIVDFAAVEKFLDTPVKRYSSGMYVRLAFGVAAHLRSEILIVDEVLAVGDGEFQQKCLGKMKDVSSDGRTVLFVSHNMAVVQKLCQRAIFFRDGRVTMDGNAFSVVEEYQRTDEITSLMLNRTVPLKKMKRWGGSGRARFTSLRLFNPLLLEDSIERPVRQGDIGIELMIEGQVEGVKGVGVQITDQYDRKIINCNTLELEDNLKLTQGARIRLIVRDVRLRPACYKLGLWIGEGEEVHTDVITDDLKLEILPPQGRKWVSKHDGTYECPFECEIVENRIRDDLDKEVHAFAHKNS
jgi:ABC-type polysaccharide/polyol phosphate transport system ATPase subunit